MKASERFIERTPVHPVPTCAVAVRSLGNTQRCGKEPAFRYLVMDDQRMRFFPLYVCVEHDDGIQKEIREDGENHAEETG